MVIQYFYNHILILFKGNGVMTLNTVATPLLRVVQSLNIEATPLLFEVLSYMLGVQTFLNEYLTYVLHLTFKRRKWWQMNAKIKTAIPTLAKSQSLEVIGLFGSAIMFQWQAITQALKKVIV